MDITSILGLLLAWAMIIAAVFLGGGRFGSFWDPASIMMVLGGGLGAMLMCLPFSTIVRLPRIVRKFFLNAPPNVPELIRQIVSLSETARREGLLALESKLDE